LGLSNLSPVQNIVDQSTIKKSSPDLASVKQRSDCEILKQTYIDLGQLKKNHKLVLRFENIHKKIGQTIYRLRFFYKDGDEGEMENFLVYQEDSSENPHIIEKSFHKKGPLYLKIEKANGNILYTDNGFNLADDNSENLLLHYSNDKIMGMQGVLQNLDVLKNIDCHFQQ